MLKLYVSTCCEAEQGATLADTGRSRTTSGVKLEAAEADVGERRFFNRDSNVCNKNIINLKSLNC
jgi:hypothetical protein